MRKIILICSTVLLVTACSKKNDNNNSSNTWTFKGTSYKAASVTYINPGSQSNLSASATGSTSTSSNGLVFSFVNPPTQSSQMLITNTSDPNTVFVSTSNLTGNTTTFYTNDVTNVKANVTVTGGKISVSFPGTIWLHNDSNFNDSAQLSVGTITQQ